MFNLAKHYTDALPDTTIPIYLGLGLALGIHWLNARPPLEESLERWKYALERRGIKDRKSKTERV